MDYELLVTPEELDSTADRFRSEQTQVSDLMAKMKSRMSALAATWGGTASNGFQAKFTGLYDDLDRAISTLEGFILDLKNASQTFSSTETTVSNGTQQLRDTNPFA